MSQGDIRGEEGKDVPDGEEYEALNEHAESG
jgi:hypothetical protein